MKNCIQKENWAILFASFWLTILTLRVFLFLCFKDVFNFSGIVIKGRHVHHYVFGFIAIISLLIIYYLKGKKVSDLRLMLLGISLGLVIDEASFWFIPRSNDYWTIINFVWAAIFGLSLAFFFLSSLKKDKASLKIDERAKIARILIKRTSWFFSRKFSYVYLFILIAFIFVLFYTASRAS